MFDGGTTRRASAGRVVCQGRFGARETSGWRSRRGLTAQFFRGFGPRTWPGQGTYPRYMAPQGCNRWPYLGCSERPQGVPQIREIPCNGAKCGSQIREFPAKPLYVVGNSQQSIYMLRIAGMGACYCMRGRHCVICIHPDLRQIEDVLTAGGKLVPTAQRFNVAKSSLARHRANCLAPKAEAAARLVQGGNEAVGRAKAILRGDAPSTSDVLNLTSFLDRIGRSLDRLEQSAVAASSDGLHNALAALSGQISRSVETAARMQNIGYKDAPLRTRGNVSGSR